MAYQQNIPRFLREKEWHWRILNLARMPFNYSLPVVSLGNGFQDPWWYQKSEDTQVSYRLVLLHFTLLCFANTVFLFLFLQIEGLWQPCIKQDCKHYFSNSICSLDVSVSHFGNSHSISSFFITIIFVTVIRDQWFLMLLL